jgi:type IV pilus assembly protein PilA
MLLHLKSNPNFSRSLTCSGFTLIELLVTIIIVGVLGSVALPSYLNQAARARGSEARTNLGAIIRGQQAFYLEYEKMATDLRQLNVKVGGKFYTYDILDSADKNIAQITAETSGLVTDIKHFKAAIIQVPASSSSSAFFGTIMCEGAEISQTPSTATPPLASGQLGSCGGDIAVR